MEDDLGVGQPLPKVYRMMDCLDDRRIRQMRSVVGNASLAALQDSAPAMFFDCTTLVFETENEDELRQKRFSKDRKYGESQVLLVLAVSREGLPINYDVLRSAAYEGHSLARVLGKTRQMLPVGRMAVVADRGMFVESSLAILNSCYVPADCKAV